MANDKLMMELDQEIKNYKTLCKLLASMTSYKELPDKEVNKVALKHCKEIDKYVRKWIAEYMDSFRKGYPNEETTIRGLIHLLENCEHLLKEAISGLNILSAANLQDRFDSEVEAFNRLMP